MAFKITIIGKVHDVGYRLLLLETADILFIPYFDARNVKIDGKEALVVLVDGDKDQIEEFLEFVNSEKPEGAVVEEIKVEEYYGRVRDIDRFRDSFNTAQLSKIVRIGLKMLDKQDLMLEKQDAMLEKQDKMLEKQDKMLEKQDAMLEKQDLMLEKQDRMLEKQDKMLEKQDKMLEKQDAMLEKQDKMLEKQDAMLEKQDAMLEKQDTTIKAIREEGEKTRRVIIDESEKTRQTVSEEAEKTRDTVGGKIDLLRSDLREYMETNLGMIKKEITEIKEALRKAGIM